MFPGADEEVLHGMYQRLEKRPSENVLHDWPPVAGVSRQEK